MLNPGYQLPSDTDRLVPPPIQVSSSDYTNNEFWFKVATIVVPVLAVIIVVILVIMAVRMLKSDNNFDTSSKLGSPGMGHRKVVLDYEAKHAPLLKQHGSSTYSPAGTNQHTFHQQINSSTQQQSSSGGSPTSFSMGGNHNVTTSSHCDKKNETQAKINQLMHLEYSLLPQSYTDSTVKLSNTDVGNVNNMYRNVNLSLTQNNRNRDNSDKIYEKEVLNPVTVNWSGSAASGSYGM